MPARECFPEHHAHRPDVGGLCRLLPGEALGRDVGERPRHVALRREGLRLLDLGEPEVEHTDRDVSSLREQHIRRLDVPVDDPTRVRVRECLEHLSRRLDGGAVVELSAAESLAEGASRDVLVGDVDVPGIPAEAVRALAGGVTEPRRGLRLSFGAGGRLALARDDLERDVEAVLLVFRQPDRARAAAPEGPQGPVAPEHKVALDEGWGRVRHQPSWVGGAIRKSCTSYSRVTVTAASAGAHHERAR